MQRGSNGLRVVAEVLGVEVAGRTAATDGVPATGSIFVGDFEPRGVGGVGTRGVDTSGVDASRIDACAASVSIVMVNASVAFEIDGTDITEGVKARGLVVRV